MSEHLRYPLLGCIQSPNFPRSFGLFDVSLVNEDAERHGSQDELHDDTCKSDKLTGLNRIVHLFIQIIVIGVMERTKLQALICGSKSTIAEIDNFVNSFDQRDISSLMGLLLYLEQQLTAKSQPLAKLNSIVSLLALTKNPQYPTISIMEVVFMPLLIDPARVAASENQVQVYEYFQNNGYSPSISNLQSLSFHYTQHCLVFCLLIAYLKPKKLYRNRQYSEISTGKQFQKQLFKDGLTEKLAYELGQKYEFLSLRKNFMKAILDFNKSPHDYIDYFMREMEYYLLNNTKRQSFNWLRSLCKEGDVYITSEALARLADILCFHSNFRIKRQCLLFIADFMNWGDLQALLLINFTEYFNTIAERIIESKRRSKSSPLIIFPQIQGQSQEKKLFLNDFLVCVERWAQIFPSLESYFMDSGKSPIYQVYQNLKQAMIQFPKWQGHQQYDMKIHNNFRLKKEQNLLFLEDLDKQKSQSIVLDPIRPTFRNLQKLYLKNYEHFNKICQMNGFTLTCQQWRELNVFHKFFEQFLQRIVDDNVASKDIDNLIEDGLTLKSNIEHFQIYYGKLQGGAINMHQFKQQIQKLQSKYYRNEDVKSKVSAVKETLKNREKSAVKVSLSECGEIVKEKIAIRIQNLALKRSDSIQEITHLELYTRNFLPNKLHSKQILENMVPLIYLHPQRKQKRMRVGIKICSEKVIEAKPSKGEETPKFRSVIEQQQHRLKKGIKVLQKHTKYEKYLMVLDRRDWVKCLTHEKVVLYKHDGLIVERSHLMLEGYRLRCKIKVNSESGRKAISVIINEQPSINISRKDNEIDDQTFQMELVGEWVKFGFNLPSLTFYSKQKKIVELPLPFAFNNYLNIRPIRQIAVKNHKRTNTYKLDSNICPQFKDIARFIRQPELKGDAMRGYVQFSEWQCNLFIHREGDSFWIELESSSESEDNILMEFLPIYLVKLLQEATFSD